MSTLAIFMGTAALGVLLLVVVGWMLCSAAHALEDSTDVFDDVLDADLSDPGTSGRLAEYVGWQDQRPMHAVSADQQRRLAARRAEAADIAIHRTVTSAREPLGVRGSDDAA